MTKLSENNLLEPNLQVSVKGIEEEAGYEVAHAVAETLQAFMQIDQDLDLRRMQQIIVATDFAGALSEIVPITASRKFIEYTNENYATAVARTLILPHDDDYKIFLVLSAHIFSWLNAKDQSHHESETYRSVLHMFHHELCHVHDNNKKIEAFPKEILKKQYMGKDSFTRPLAEVCWAEYIANYMSSSSVTPESIVMVTDSMADAIARTKQLIDNEILSYRYHGDLQKILNIFSRHGGFLIKSAAYVLGYVDGLDRGLDDLSAPTHKFLVGSYFEKTFTELHFALRDMLRTYPDGWSSLDVFEPLVDVIEKYYASMGLILSTTEDGSAYVDIPLTPETDPDHFVG